LRVLVRAAGAVDLDAQLAVRPEEVHFDASPGGLNCGVGEGVGQAGGSDQREEAVLDRALGARAALFVQGERL
jgi:hypothetical protein